MRYLTLVFALAIPLTLSAQAPMSEVSTLRAEAHVLRVQVVQLRAALAQAQAEIELGKLTAERAQLEAMLREELKPAEGSTFDWATLTFKAPAK